MMVVPQYDNTKREKNMIKSWFKNKKSPTGIALSLQKQKKRFSKKSLIKIFGNKHFFKSLTIAY